MTLKMLCPQLEMVGSSRNSIYVVDIEISLAEADIKLQIAQSLRIPPVVLATLRRRAQQADWLEEDLKRLEESCTLPPL